MSGIFSLLNKLRDQTSPLYQTGIGILKGALGDDVNDMIDFLDDRIVEVSELIKKIERYLG